MDKLLERVKKELKDISEQGLNTNNLDMTYKLVDILKDLVTTKKMEDEKYMQEYRGYMEGGRGGNSYREGDYNRGGNSGYGRAQYRGNNPRMRDKVERIMEGIDMYEYGRERYMHGGASEERIYDGLEKLMYAICMFIESTMEFAETPQEKEIIRKHIQKLHSI